MASDSRDLRSTASGSSSSSAAVCEPPLNVLPVVYRDLRADKVHKFFGYYHFDHLRPAQQNPTYAGDFYNSNLGNLFAVVAASDSVTSDLPGRFDLVNDSHRLTKSWNCPIMTTWLSTKGRTVLLPPEVPDWKTAKRSDLLKILFPNKSWNEHVVVQASKSPPKFFYKNPCAIEDFKITVKRLKTLKKFSDSENEKTNRKNKIHGFDSAAAKILIPPTMLEKIQSSDGKKSASMKVSSTSPQDDPKTPLRRSARFTPKKGDPEVTAATAPPTNESEKSAKRRGPPPDLMPITEETATEAHHQEDKGGADTEDVTMNDQQARPDDDENGAPMEVDSPEEAATGGDGDGGQAADDPDPNNVENDGNDEEKNEEDEKNEKDGDEKNEEDEDDENEDEKEDDEKKESDDEESDEKSDDEEEGIENEEDNENGVEANEPRQILGYFREDNNGLEVVVETELMVEEEEDVADDEDLEPTTPKEPAESTSIQEVILQVKKEQASRGKSTSRINTAGDENRLKKEVRNKNLLVQLNKMNLLKNNKAFVPCPQRPKPIRESAADEHVPDDDQVEAQVDAQVDAQVEAEKSKTKTNSNKEPKPKRKPKPKQPDERVEAERKRKPQEPKTPLAAVAKHVTEVGGFGSPGSVNEFGEEIEGGPDHSSAHNSLVQALSSPGLSPVRNQDLVGFGDLAEIVKDLTTGTDNEVILALAKVATASLEVQKRNTDLVERLTRQITCLLTLQPQDGQFLIAQRESRLYQDVMGLINELVKFPQMSKGRIRLLDRVLKSSVHIRLLFVIYLTSVTQGGNVYQIANYLWARMFSDEFSMFISWSQDCDTGKNTRTLGHKDQQREFVCLRTYAPQVCCLMYAVIRRRCVLSGRKLPSTFLINSALTEARKQAVTRFSRDQKKGGPIDLQEFEDSTSPANFYLHAGNMEDDLAEFPDKLYDYHREDLIPRGLGCPMCPIRGKIHKKDTAGTRNRTMNQSYHREHQRFRTWALNLGAFERNAMSEMAKNGILFYGTDTFRLHYEKALDMVENFVDEDETDEPAPEDLASIPEEDEAVEEQEEEEDDDDGESGTDDDDDDDDDEPPPPPRNTRPPGAKRNIAEVIKEVEELNAAAAAKKKEAKKPKGAAKKKQTAAQQDKEDDEDREEIQRLTQEFYKEKAKLEAQKKKGVAAAKKANEAADKLAKEAAAEKKAKEAADKLAKEAAAKKAKEAADKLAKEAATKKAKEAADKLAKPKQTANTKKPEPAKKRSADNSANDDGPRVKKAKVLEAKSKDQQQQKKPPPKK